ncbi:MAG: DEAD/DEAH box helicase, partial [Holophagales bacterium]|nr:DEAD/DEAH box helicase [Holophagales bacterium]
LRGRHPEAGRRDLRQGALLAGAAHPDQPELPEDDDRRSSWRRCFEPAAPRSSAARRPKGEPLSLYAHQEQAIALASSGETFVVTTGTGSGKSLCFFIPIVSAILAEKKRDPRRRTRAIIIYPMNALANSQLEELEKYLKNVPAPAPITFARYTGQESDDERRRIADNPPDILLTNFMMLELLMTRQEDVDRKVIGNCAGLRFLVLDELHTYRGRQGADVAPAGAPGAGAAVPRGLQCIGTSATMASEGSVEDKGRVVARVASKLFSIEIPESNVIVETLERVTDPSDEATRCAGLGRLTLASAERLRRRPAHAPAGRLGRDLARRAVVRRRPALGAGAPCTVSEAVARG